MPGGYEGGCEPGQERPLAAVPAGTPDAGVLAGAVLAGAAAGGAAELIAAAELAAGAAAPVPELAAWPPAAWSVPAPHPATTTDREARARNRMRMPRRRRNRARGCARRSVTGVTHGMTKDNGNRRSRRFAAPAAVQANAGMTSVANSSAERRVSANVMSPNANSSEK